MPLEDDIPNGVYALTRVLQGQPIEEALSNDNYLRPLPSRVKAWVYGVCRHYYSLQEQLEKLVSKPLERLDNEVLGTLLIGAFRIQHSDTPQPIVVSASVDAIQRLKKGSAKGLVNAVLRKTTKDYQPQSEEAKSELPQWLLDALGQAYSNTVGLEWLSNLTIQMPQMLRINCRRTSPDRFMDRLREANVQAELTDHPLAFRLTSPQATMSIPGYEEGWFSAQDANAQRAVRLLAPQPKARVLDACAAPGNKSLQLLEQFPTIQLTAIDVSPARAKFGKLEAKRLGLPLQIKEGDATQLDWWDGQLFDRILIDAPCSALGTLARRPDVKLHRTKEQLKLLQSRQIALIDNLLNTLKPKGQIIYCTCSLLPDENDNVIAQVTREREDVIANHSLDLPGVPVNTFTRQKFGTQLLPNPLVGDGFYFARLTKTATQS